MGDLVKRLRSGFDPSTLITLGGKRHDGRSLEAADRIEALEAQLAAADELARCIEDLQATWAPNASGIPESLAAYREARAP
jgi:hypothetical protein